MRMHLANGDIDVQRSRLPEGGEESVDATVRIMAKMAKGEYGSRSAKIRALAINLINAANVPDKDYYGMAKAIHEWVRDQIRYVKDPIGDGEDGETLNQETLSYPEETAFNSMAGDCLDGDTRLLTPAGYKAIRDIREGDVIQGKDGWTKVLRWFDKGELPTFRVLLDNGAHFYATGEHRCFLREGDETTVAELSEDDALLGPSTIDLPTSSEFLTDDDYYFIGLYLADGWCDANRVCISGKDGFAKEANKHWVTAWAAKKGWETSWHSRYVRVYIPKDHPLFALLHDGKVAPDKAIPDVVLANLTQGKAQRLLDGLLADCHHPLRSQRVIGAERTRQSVRRSGLCYSTTSHDLAKQVRLLFRFQGVSVRDTLVVDHGGLGTHPVHRIYPRYFRDKPARVDAVEPDEVRHVYDITTEDHGIYLPDADVVVHNCDDKTILEMALLGSVGIQSYPVVIGTTPGRYSHVYLNIVLPPGKYLHAGETIPADPIMREWPLGKEAPAYKVKLKKLYTDLSGLSMDLGAYASAPPYLDEKNLSSVGPVLNSNITDTGGRGRIMNVTQLTRPSDDLDDMFQRGIEMPTQPAQLQSLLNLGPITARREHKLTSYLEVEGAKKIPRRSGSKLVEVAEGQRAAHPYPDTGPTVGELLGLADCLSAIEHELDACDGFMGVAGPADPLHRAAAASAYAHARARKATERVLRGAGMFGLGDVNVQDARQTEAMAHAVAKKAEAVAQKGARSPARKAALQSDYRKLKTLDQAHRVADMVAKQPRTTDHIHDAAIKVGTLAVMMHNGKAVRIAHNTLLDRAARKLPGEPLKTPLKGATVRDQFGRVLYSTDLAGAPHAPHGPHGPRPPMHPAPPSAAIRAHGRALLAGVKRAHERIEGLGKFSFKKAVSGVKQNFGPLTVKNIANKMLNPVEQMKAPVKIMKGVSAGAPAGIQKAMNIATMTMNPLKVMTAPAALRKPITQLVKSANKKTSGSPASSGTPLPPGVTPPPPDTPPQQPYTDPNTGYTYDPSTGTWTDPATGNTYNPATGQWSNQGNSQPPYDPNTGMTYQPGLGPDDPYAQQNYPDPFAQQDGMGPAQSEDFPADYGDQGPMPSDGSDMSAPGAMGPTPFDPGMDTGPQDTFGPDDVTASSGDDYNSGDNSGDSGFDPGMPADDGSQPGDDATESYASTDDTSDTDVDGGGGGPGGGSSYLGPAIDGLGDDTQQPRGVTAFFHQHPYESVGLGVGGIAVLGFLGYLLFAKRK